MGRPFVDEKLTATMVDGSIVNLYDAPPFTRKPTCDLLLCMSLRRFYWVSPEDDRAVWGWVDGRGRLQRGVAIASLLRGALGLSKGEIEVAKQHILHHHCVFLCPHRYEGFKFWVPHNIGSVRLGTGHLGAGTDLTHLI